MKKTIWVVAALFLAAGQTGTAGSGLALAPGIGEPRVGVQAYTGLFHLAFYNPGTSLDQMSSHDERDYNIDLMHFHGRHDFGRVLMRAQGPGVIQRIWSADPTGTLFFYIDGGKKPAFSCGFKDYLEGKCHSDKAFAVGRYANYTPLPFQRSIIVTARGFKLAGAYYQITWMNTGGIGAAPADETDLSLARKFWETNGREPGRDPGGIALTASSARLLEPGQTHTITIDGAGLVTSFFLRDAKDPLDPLSDLGLKIFWDGETEPAVDSPADAFFGNLFDSRRFSKKGPYETLAVSATHEGYSSRWPMPFAAGMKLEIENRGGETKDLEVVIQYRGVDSLPPNAMRFHAAFNSVDYPDDITRDKVHGLFYRVDQSGNYVVLDREGRGYYAGCFLFVIGLGTDWWGEGDEMIWVDGAGKARIRGTGTEDEFNWSYGFKENRSPVSGALRVGPRDKATPQTNQGHNVLYRLRPGDYVPFTDSIKVTYERLGSTNRMMPRYPGSLVNVSSDRGDDYRSVAYWYEVPAKEKQP